MAKRKEPQVPNAESAVADAPSPVATLPVQTLPGDTLELNAPSAEPAKIEAHSIEAKPLAPSPVVSEPSDSIAGETGAAAAEPELKAARWQWPSYAPLAACVALAAAVGALAGSVTTAGLVHRSSTEASIADDARTLAATVTQLNNDFAALKTTFSTTQRSASAQIGRLADRVERTEKSQSEPAAKIARLTETVDRLERRQHIAAVAPDASDITGSVPAAKQPKDVKGELRPKIADGWKLRDFYQGRAVVESREGMLFEVVPGSNLPGLGKVEGIRRENGRVVVIARNGIIAAALNARRPPVYAPYRY